MAKKEKNVKIDALRALAGSESTVEDTITEVIPTGHSELDFYISRGIYQDEHGKDLEYNEEVIYGLPTGKLAMFYGGEGSGKSSLAYKIAGNAQKMGKTVFWVDAENSFNPQLARINGVNTKDIIIQRLWDKEKPETIFDAETILDKMMEACKLGAGVVVLDSVASLIPRYVMENPAEKDTMAALARLLSKTLNKMAAYAAAHNSLVIFLNQLRTNPGVSFGNPEGTTGGNALKHMCSVVLKVTKLTAEKWLHHVEGENGEPEVVAGSASIKIEKNRFSSPLRTTVAIPIYFKYYFPSAEQVIFEYGRKTKTISVRNNVYSWDKIKAEGRNAFIEEMKNSPKMIDLIAEIKEGAATENIPLPPEVLSYEHHVHFVKNNEVFQNEEVDGDNVDGSKKIVKKSKKSKEKVAVAAVLVDETPEL